MTFDATIQDIRFGIRLLRKNPGFTLITVLTLALAIGANTAIFSVVNGLLLRPLPYPEAGRLVNVWQVYNEWLTSDVEVFRARASHFPASYPVYQAWVDKGHMFEGIAAYTGMSSIVAGRDVAEWVGATEAAASLFSVLGVEPQIGRGFRPEEDRVGADRVVVLSHGFWQRHFGGDPAVLGQTLELTGVPHTIIGVMPAGFYFPDRDNELWVLLQDRRRNDRWTSQSLSTVARLRPGVSLPQAQLEMDAVTEQILEENPDSPEVGIRLVARVNEVVGEARRTALLLLAAVGLVLVVAASNIAGLLLVRATGRRQEIGVRAALGAGRGRLLAQMAIESGVLTTPGGIVGLALAASGLSGLRSLLPASTPRLEEIVIDRSVLGFTLGVSALIALVFGLALALRSRRRSLVEALRGTAGTVAGSRQRSRAALVVGEVTVAVVLLIGAALLVSSYLHLWAQDRGFDPRNLLTLNVMAPIDRYVEGDEIVAFHRDLLERISTLPGVVSQSSVSTLPFSGGQSSSSFQIDPTLDDDDAWSLEENVSPGYFRTMGIPLLRGRTFTDADTADTEQVRVVNERLAHTYWPDQDPIGQRIIDDGVEATIVGVVGNIKHNNLGEEIERKRYRPLAQHPNNFAWLVIRTASDPAGLAAQVRSLVHDLDPGTALDDVATMERLVAESVALARFRTLLLTLLALTAVVLAIVGVYGVVSYVVAQRNREIGVRMTLGAGRRDILRQVMGSGMLLVAPGIVLGLAAAAASTRMIESYLFEVSTIDLLTFAAAAGLVALVAALATWVPARRATRIEPLIVLRGQ